MSRTARFTFQKVSFRHRGISGPKGTCTKESFERADGYAAQPEDVFVVTQMKCGTTWMQHVVYEVLNRGHGNLVDSGSTLYAVSPWLEAIRNVSMDDAPRIGNERPSRVIKTHFPAHLCPYSSEARYIYVARHPVSCFASCVDFIATNLGAFGPSLDQMEEWFCSDELMWWGTWTEHVKGWWDVSRRQDNVLFVQFEDMKQGLPEIVRRVAAFLAVKPLADDEVERVVTKCGFEYMQRHEDAFEMFPPNILATDARLFIKGTADRHEDVPEAVRVRIQDWAAAGMRDSGYPLDAF
jgi:hypothetical protein